jgi:ABC-type multidrug transport system fused ATPase/permease subunit
VTSLETLLSRVRGYLADYFLVLGSARTKLRGIGFMMIVLAALDLLGVGLIMPFAQLLGPGADQHGVPGLSSDPQRSFLLLGLILLGVFAVKAVMGYRLSFAIQSFSESYRADLVRRLMTAYQAQNWQFYLERNTSELVNRLLWYTDSYAGGTLASSLQIATNGLVCVVLFVLLAANDIVSVSILAVLLGLVFLAIHHMVRPQLKARTMAAADEYGKLIRSAKQGLEGFREVRVLGTELHFRAEVTRAAVGLGEANASRAVLAMIPRYAFEVAMVAGLVAIGGARTWLDGSTAAAVPVIGMFAAAGMRLLPAATSLLYSFNQIRASRFALRELAAELAILDPSTETDAPLPAGPPAEPFQSLELKNVTFQYPSGQAPVLRDVDITIHAGDAVGLMGKSGAGKSTLADVLLGFFTPQSGEVLVNGRAMHADLRGWLRRATYIPQRVFLIDDTLRANIEFGAPHGPRREERMSEAVEQAQLADLVATLPQGLDTIVGEAGTRLSGGQRQRVALARALFHEREFIVLDEATSALDQETEDAVVQAVFGLAGRKTLFIIAHRESTLAGCRSRLFLQDGHITRLDSADCAPAIEVPISAGRHV